LKGSPDAYEVTEDLGVEEDLAAESDTASPGEASGTEMPPQEAQATVEGNTATSAEIISLAQREKDAKDLFYNILCGSFDVANGRVAKGMPEGPYKSLDLKGYGDIGRTASDQFFDRLCEVAIIKRWLYKLNENALMNKWGAIFVLGYSVQSNFRDEHADRLKERSLRNEDEKPVKEQAA